MIKNTEYKKYYIKNTEIETKGHILFNFMLPVCFILFWKFCKWQNR